MTEVRDSEALDKGGFNTTPPTYLRGAIFLGPYLVFIGDTVREDNAWRIFTGWGDLEEINSKKKEGYRFAIVEVKEKV